MEPFDINLDGKTLTVTLQEDGSYLVNESDSAVGTLIPDVNELGVQWTTKDPIAPDYVKQIGELIEEHDL